jgi:hypothetical protein
MSVTLVAENEFQGNPHRNTEHPMTPQLSVPDRWFGEVERYLQFLIASEQNSEALAPGDETADYPLWADEDLIALRNAGTSTAKNMSRIVDSVIRSGRIGEWISIPEIADLSGIPEKTIRNVRTQLYRYINSRFAPGTLAPFTAIRGEKLRPAKSREVYYRLSSDFAEQWRRTTM